MIWYKAVIEKLLVDSYPHHFQRRAEDGSWIFEASPMRGDLEPEIDTVIAVVRTYLRKE